MWSKSEITRILVDWDRDPQEALERLTPLSTPNCGRERDSLTTAPRFRFANVDGYYYRASVATHIQKLGIRALLVESQNEPIVPIQELRSAAEQAPSCLTVRWLDTGSPPVFPVGLNLGQSAPLGLQPQVIRWLSKV
jgi:predicted alpha/beta-fold hydrolase